MQEELLDRDRWKTLPIKYPVLLAEHFAVFIDPEIEIDWETDHIYDATPHPDAHNHFLILNEAALLEATPCEGFPVQNKLQFKRLIAEGIARSFEHDCDSAWAALEAARAFVLARGQEVSRKWYLSASFMATAPAVILGFLAWVCRDWVRTGLGNEFLWVGLAATAGSIGALFSIITRTGKLHFDFSAGARIHYLEAASRICAGAIGGFLAYVAIHSGLLLSALSQGERAEWIVVLAAFAAGTGERLVSSIISTVHKSDSRNEAEPNADGSAPASRRDPGIARGRPSPKRAPTAGVG